MLKVTLIITASLILPLTSFGQEPVKPAEKPAEQKQAAPKEKPAPPEEKPAPKKQAAPAEEPQPKEDEKSEDQTILDELTLANNLTAERHKHETAGLRAEIARLKLEKELFAEKLAAASLDKSDENLKELAAYEAEKEALTREAALAKLELETVGARLKSAQTQASLHSTELEGQIREIETRKKRDAYADASPQYLDNPLREDGTLVISDRRIPFNGAVTSSLAESVTTRINYFNNKDPKKPIFIVIDSSPGGSVMAGYRILKAMEGSEAPVYVVVKSFAASMAACITTLAERSFAYPNAVILHHQISSTYFYTSMNLTDQKEAYEDMQRWWHRLADPISAKMGITSDEFIEQMYEKTKSGDWTEFGDDAKKLKWVDTIVSRIHETALLTDPDAKKTTTPVRKTSYSATDITPSVDDNGVPILLLPRRNPKDVYFMYNPDGYYRFK
ncbi:MAG: ATP-dependent Clp protease proteolytic subunit [Akkermansiaceae bacterium]